MVRDMREAGHINVAPWYIYIPKVAAVGFLSLVFAITEAIYLYITKLFSDPRNINGKVIIVTGSGRGLGRELCLKLARGGAHLACVDINTKNNGETVEMINREGGKAKGFTVNIAKCEEVKKLVDDVNRSLGPVDIMVNNAALIYPSRFEEYTESDFRVQFDVNALGLAYFLRYLVPEMKKRKHCQIVAVSSMSAKINTPYLTIYSATKAAVTGMMNALRLEMDLDGNPSNLTLSTVHPYFINTSADYMELFDIGLPVLDPNTVADAIVKTIHYRYREITVPSFLGFFISLSKVLPLSLPKHLLTLIRPTVRLKDQTYWKQLPYQTVLENTVHSDS